MKKQKISIFLNVLGWFFGIAGTLASIIVGANASSSLVGIIIPVGIIVSLTNLGLFLGLSQIITNTYNAYLNTLPKNGVKTPAAANSASAESVKDELPDL